MAPSTSRAKKIRKTPSSPARKRRNSQRMERTNQNHFQCPSQMYVSPKWIKEPSLSCLAPWIIKDLFEPVEKLLLKDIKKEWKDIDFSKHSASAICVGPLKTKLEAISNEMTDEFKTFNTWFTLKHVHQAPFVGVIVKNKGGTISYYFMNLEQILFENSK
jgi:hypothetical protein